MKLTRAFITIPLLALTACNHPPQGRWVATYQAEILAQRDNPMEVAFYVQKGEICALSDHWYYEKDLRYKEVRCDKGTGWITSEEPFQKIGD